MAGYNPPLFFNLSTWSWIKSLAEPVSIGPIKWIFGDTKTLKVTFVEDVTTGGTDVQVVTSTSSVACFFASAAGQAVLTSATATGPDTAHAWTIVLPFNVAGIQALAGRQCVLEFFLGGADRYQAPIKVLDQVNSGALLPTPPSDITLGTNAAKTMFLLRDCDQDSSGSAFFFKGRSADGTSWGVSISNSGAWSVERLS